jgi:hypothetical protein
MNMEDKTDWIFLDDAPADLRDHTLLRHHPRNRDELFASLKSADMDYLRRTGIYAHDNFSHRKIDPDAVRDRQHITAESRATAHQDHARKFVQKLLLSIGPADRVKISAPVRFLDPRGGKRDRDAWNPRYPKLTERHEPYLNSGHRSFTTTAEKNGRTAEFGATVRAEILITQLAAGICPTVGGGIVDGRRRSEDEVEAPYAAVIVSEIWRVHEDALSEAETRGIFRTPVELLSRSAKLLGGMLVAMTVLKIGPSRSTVYRSFFIELAKLIEACREDAKA